MSERLVLGRYRVVSRLAQGGMGVVSLGRVEGAAGFSKPVIIKRILPGLDDQEDHTARFIREAQILSQLQHPCIVGVLDFGQEEDGYAMVLEYMHGYDLGRWLKYLQLTSTRMPWDEAVFIILRALDGLHYAHTFHRSDGTPAGVLHRDISPGNILLDLEGQVRLLDFGIARTLQADADQYKTQDGVLSGKIGYLAPELFSASASSVASDIYACSVVLYLMLAGVHPFSAESESRTMWRVLNEMPAPLSRWQRDLPGELETTLFRALAKQPEQRHESAEQLARELRRLLPRNESEILCSLRQRLRRDFTGELPSLLKVEPLADRDRAWRTAQSTTQPSVAPLRSSRLPAPLQSQPPTLVLPTALARAGASSALESTDGPPSPLVSDVARSGRSSLRKLALALGLGLPVLVGSLLSWSASQPAASPGRLIVVESPEAHEPAAALLAAAAAKEPAAPLAPAVAGSYVPDESGLISRQLARRQAALQACFQQFPKEQAARAPIILGFDVAQSGQVTAASLEPVSLEETSIGQCLLRVARATQFQPLRDPIHFSVPLQARALAK
jgi:serine/threonine protein kinase